MPGGIRPPPSVLALWPTPTMTNPESHGPHSIILAGPRKSTAQYGANLHTWDNTLPNLIAQRKVALAMEMLYVVGAGLVRISVLLFYRRMGFRSISRGFMATIWISVYSVVAYSVAFVAVIYVSCQPLNAFWNQINPVWEATHHWKCYNEPVHIIILRISPREKLALGSIFVVGYLTPVIAGVRLYFIVRLYYVSYDASWTSWYCWMLAMMEVLIAITCSSLPAARVFFSRYKMYVDVVGTAWGIKEALSRSRSTYQGSGSAHRSRRESSSTVKLAEPVQFETSRSLSEDGGANFELHKLPA
ncbi:hypothetical protein BBP40_010944 [Aspergillus hancockii]|nr:hypothetical protein BBP40_010944 [Aspergillus hancockii]